MTVMTGRKGAKGGAERMVMTVAGRGQAKVAGLFRNLQ